MSRTFKDTPNSKHSRPKRSRLRSISVQAVRRDPPDVKRLSRALITLALAESQRAGSDNTDTDTGVDNAASDHPDDQAQAVRPDTDPDRSPDA